MKKMSAGHTVRRFSRFRQNHDSMFWEHFVRIHLQLSTKALASSSRAFDKATVRQSVMLKKCFSRPMNVD